MALTLASNAITFTDSTSLSSGIIGTAQLSAGAVTAEKVASGAVLDILPSGSVLQTVSFINANQTQITNTMSFGSSAPTTSDGVVILSATVIPNSETSNFLVRAVIQGTANSGEYQIGAIFRNDNPTPLGVAFSYGAGYSASMAIETFDSPNTILPVTYTVRAGPDTGTFYFNDQYSSTGRFGGTCKSCLVVQEIKG